MGWEKVILSGSNARLRTVSASNGINANLSAGTDNSVVVLTAGNNLVTDEIDSRVWGSTLIDAAGTAVAQQIGFFTDANTMSGSSAFSWDGSILRTLSIINNSSVSGTQLTGSFTGSFVGDGSGLTGLPSAAINSYTNSGNNRIITSVDSTTVNGEANLTFDGTLLTVTGNQNTTGTGSFGALSGSALFLNSIPAGLDNTVLILSSDGEVKTDEIDSRVWGASLVDNAGGNAASTRIAYWSDGDSLQGNANLTYDGTALAVGNSTFGTNTVIAGNLTILGDSIQQNVADLLVEDRFILLNSGSSFGDAGIIVQATSSFSGSAFFWDHSEKRWAFHYTSSQGPAGGQLLGSSATTGSAHAYVAAVTTFASADYEKNGNIRIENGEIFMYIE